MSEPLEILAQLLSPAQAETLDATGRESWGAASASLGSIQGGAPAISGLEARLVMPDEITGEFSEPHLLVPLELSTDQDQTGTAYLVAPTRLAAAFLDSQADNPEDEEQQTIVIASTVLGQVVQALNTVVFARSTSGLVVAMDEVAANSMPDVLAEMDDPCMYLTATLSGARPMPIALVLPGTFLDILAGAMAGVVGAEVRVATPAVEAGISFELTQEDIEAAKLLEEMPAEPILATIGGSSRQEGPQAAPPLPKQPTPIGPAASRARFAPLPEHDHASPRSGIDLLAGLQMNVSVELGRTELTVAEVLGLGPGSVVELDRLAGEPADILVNGTLIAKGEVVVVDEKFGVRVIEVVSRAKRIASLG